MIKYLYKYGRINDHSEALFSTPEVFFQSPSRLNDPFECRPHFTFNGTREQIVEALERYLRKSMTKDNAAAHAISIFLEGRYRNPDIWKKLESSILEMLGNRIGFYCMSEKPDHILMWSHYADDHRGFCLKFEATDNTPFFGAAQKVNYSSRYPTVDFFNTPNEDQVDLIFLTKFEDWKYEAEWRIIDHHEGPGLKSYPVELLKGVIFGMRINEKYKQKIREWVARRGAEVKFYQASQHERQYAINITEVA